MGCNNKTKTPRVIFLCLVGAYNWSEARRRRARRVALPQRRAGGVGWKVESGVSRRNQMYGSSAAHGMTKPLKAFLRNPCGRACAGPDCRAAKSPFRNRGTDICALRE
jgi:hypothetical protein